MLAYQLVLQTILLFFVLKFFKREMISLYDIGAAGYFTKGWNFFDLLSVLINMAYIIIGAITLKDFETGIY